MAQFGELRMLRSDSLERQDLELKVGWIICFFTDSSSPRHSFLFAPYIMHISWCLVLPTFQIFSEKSEVQEIKRWFLYLFKFIGNKLILLCWITSLYAFFVQDEICRSVADNGGIDAILLTIDHCGEQGNKTVARACFSLLSKVQSLTNNSLASC